MRFQPAEPDLERGEALGLPWPARRRKEYTMFEETPYLQPQPGTDGSHRAWPTAPEVHTRAPVETGKETDATAAHAKQNRG